MAGIFFSCKDKDPVSEFIAEQASELGSDIEITGYASFVLGDGVEKDF